MSMTQHSSYLRWKYANDGWDHGSSYLQSLAVTDLVSGDLRTHFRYCISKMHVVLLCVCVICILLDIVRVSGSLRATHRTAAGPRDPARREPTPPAPRASHDPTAPPRPPRARPPACPALRTRHTMNLENTCLPAPPSCCPGWYCRRGQSVLARTRNRTYTPAHRHPILAALTTNARQQHLHSNSTCNSSVAAIQSATQPQCSGHIAAPPQQLRRDSSFFGSLRPSRCQYNAELLSYHATQCAVMACACRPC